MGQAVLENTNGVLNYSPIDGLPELRDAIAELDGIDGLQVHRSWWVARGAVSDVQREGRNIRLTLDTGVEAPVSRANVQVLKDAGWI